MSAEPRHELTPRLELLEASREERRRRRASLGTGVLIQIPVAFLLLWVLAAPPARRDRGVSNNLRTISITLPAVPPAVQPRHLVRRRMTEPPVERAQRIIPPPRQKLTIEVPRFSPRVTGKPVQRPVVAESLPQSHPSVDTFKVSVPKWKPKIDVGAFTGGRAVATLRRPIAKVQTGGFGDPKGLPGRAEGGARGNVPHLGSFDQPEGPGSGNGTGGARGARGMVASAGFGNDIAAPVQNGSTPGAVRVRSAGFANEDTPARAGPAQQTSPAAARFQPVEIISKPVPVYSEEARRLHVQGVVLVRVIFTASGRVRVLSVERGLGHGLDQSAVRAAEAIQFKPAQRDGRPVDLPATLQIVFQLAQ